MADVIQPTESTSDLLARHKREIQERIELLKPLVEEFSTLEGVLRAMGDGPPEPPKRRGRPPKNPQA